MSLTLRAACLRPFPPMLLFTCLMFAGCSSNDSPGRGPGGTLRHAVAIPTLKGQAAYFADQILAEVQIGAMAGFAPRGDGDKPSGAGFPPQGRRRHGGGGPGGMEGPRPDRDGENPPPLAMRRTEGGGSPPVAIHLRFTNQGANPVDLEIADFVSSLGNFAVQPSHLQLAPGQSAEVEPMGSRLANDAISGEISLSLRLNGVKETKTVSVQVAPSPATPTKD